MASSTPSSPAPRALLTGATGFVGQRLYPSLEGAGFEVACLTRDPAHARARWPQRRWVQGDVSDEASLDRALDGCRVAWYLVHGMGDQEGDFHKREVAQAEGFARAAARAGVERVVYLGGVAPRVHASEHLRSRLEVGAALRAGAVPTVELRASMIIGHGSLSWLIVRDLAARLPVMLLPRWLASRTEPVAVSDVVAALTAAHAIPLDGSAWFDVPGPEVLSGREILERTAEMLGRRRPLVLPVPVLTPGLSSHWVRLVTRARWSVARELVVGLTEDLLAQDARYWALIGHPSCLDFAEAARRALDEERAEGPIPGTWGRVERFLGVSPRPHVPA